MLGDRPAIGRELTFLLPRFTGNEPTSQVTKGPRLFLAGGTTAAHVLCQRSYLQ